MTVEPEVEVILPCLNEVQGLRWVLERMPAEMSALVVDNGSDDGSADLARAFGARVVQADQRGYGAACQAGLLAATAPIVAVMDADASLDPRELVRVVQPIACDEADLVLGRRQPARRRLPVAARVANRALVTRIRRRTGIRLRDLGPMRAAHRDSWSAWS